MSISRRLHRKPLLPPQPLRSGVVDGIWQGVAYGDPWKGRPKALTG
ncbi:hypothetical protein H8D30_00930 [bacterium]|nr:hypothetical protein [bacterium]